MANRYLSTHGIFIGVEEFFYGAARRNLGMVC
jgi:hypothetical protein